MAAGASIKYIFGSDYQLRPMVGCFAYIRFQAPVIFFDGVGKPTHTYKSDAKVLVGIVVISSWGTSVGGRVLGKISRIHWPNLFVLDIFPADVGSEFSRSRAFLNGKSGIGG